MKAITYTLAVVLVLPLVAVGISGIAHGGDVGKSGDFFSPDPADRDLADVGKFKGSLGGAFRGWMRAGYGWNEPPYVSPDTPKFGCGIGPVGSVFGPTPPGPGC